MDPGRVMREAWDLYRAHLRHLATIGFVFYAALAAVSMVLVLLLDETGLWISLFISFAAVFWLQGALVEAVADVRGGRSDLSVRQTFERVGRRINVLSVAGVLASFGVGLGLVIFIVPGLVLLTMWALIVPAIMLERSGALAAFGRSRQLVAGYGWNVFTVIAVTAVLMIAASLVVGLLLRPLPDWLEGLATNLVSNTFFAPYVAVAWTLVYYRLRELKEPAGRAA